MRRLFLALILALGPLACGSEIPKVKEIPSVVDVTADQLQIALEGAARVVKPSVEFVYGYCEFRPGESCDQLQAALDGAVAALSVANGVLKDYRAGRAAFDLAKVSVENAVKDCAKFETLVKEIASSSL